MLESRHHIAKAPWANAWKLLCSWNGNPRANTKQRIPNEIVWCAARAKHVLQKQQQKWISNVFGGILHLVSLHCMLLCAMYRVYINSMWYLRDNEALKRTNEKVVVQSRATVKFTLKIQSNTLPSRTWKT